MGCKPGPNPEKGPLPLIPANPIQKPNTPGVTGPFGPLPLHKSYENNNMIPNNTGLVTSGGFAGAFGTLPMKRSTLTLSLENQEKDPNKKAATQRFQAVMGEIRDLSVQEQVKELKRMVSSLV